MLLKVSNVHLLEPVETLQHGWLTLLIAVLCVALLDEYLDKIR
jgi:hypothetical protein